MQRTASQCPQAKSTWDLEILENTIGGFRTTFGNRTTITHEELISFLNNLKDTTRGSFVKYINIMRELKIVTISAKQLPIHTDPKRNKWIRPGTQYAYYLFQGIKNTYGDKWFSMTFEYKELSFAWDLYIGFGSSDDCGDVAIAIDIQDPSHDTEERKLRDDMKSQWALSRGCTPEYFDPRTMFATHFLANVTDHIEWALLKTNPDYLKQYIQKSFIKDEKRRALARSEVFDDDVDLGMVEQIMEWDTVCDSGKLIAMDDFLRYVRVDPETQLGEKCQTILIKFLKSRCLSGEDYDPHTFSTSWETMMRMLSHLAVMISESDGFPNSCRRIDICLQYLLTFRRLIKEIIKKVNRFDMLQKGRLSSTMFKAVDHELQKQKDSYERQLVSRDNTIDALRYQIIQYQKSNPKHCPADVFTLCLEEGKSILKEAPDFPIRYSKYSTTPIELAHVESVLRTSNVRNTYRIMQGIKRNLQHINGFVVMLEDMSVDEKIPEVQDTSEESSKSDDDDDSNDSSDDDDLSA